jgi:hypothetical protein
MVCSRNQVAADGRGRIVTYIYEVVIGLFGPLSNTGAPVPRWNFLSAALDFLIAANLQWGFLRKLRQHPFGDTLVKYFCLHGGSHSFLVFINN